MILVLPPRDEYLSRLDARRRSLDALTGADARLSYFRMAAFAAFAVLLFTGARGLTAWSWLAPPAVLFFWLVRRHDRLIRARDQAGRAVLFYQRGLARLDDAWAGTGEAGERFTDPDHLYAADLDLFGTGSLFELLSIARTRIGEERLAAWLKAPASPAVVRERQAAVDELASRPDLRERVALAGADVGAGVESDALTSWAEEAPQLPHGWMRIAAIALTAAAIAGAVQWARTGSAGVLIVIVLLELALFMAHRPRMHRILHAAGGWSRDLDVLAHVLDQIERETFSSAPLASLRARLDAAGAPPGRAIRHLHRLVEMHDWQHNLLFAIIATPLLWDVHVAFAMEAWRARYGRHVRDWLACVGDFEALSSLATYRFEHPADPFP